MKILHTCLSCFYIDDRAYQENELTEEHKRQGHDVFVLASTQIHGDDGHRAYCDTGEYLTSSGIRVKRIPFRKHLPVKIARKIKTYDSVFEIISEYNPDVIMIHGICFWDIQRVVQYKLINPDVIIYADTHTDFIYSARNIVSKWILHYCIYRYSLLKSLKHIEKILYVSLLTKEFAHDFYGIPSNKLEFFPLGGKPLTNRVYDENRKITRNNLMLCEDDIVFLQSGKQTIKKKLLESLAQFTKVKNTKWKYIIVGLLMDDIEQELKTLIDKDNRIIYLGWKKPDKLEQFLCAADVYLQPGMQSSTMQTSLCCRCAVILDNWPSHHEYVKNNGWLIDSTQELKIIFEKINKNPAILDKMKESSYSYALKKLDYKILSKRILTK